MRTVYDVRVVTRHSPRRRALATNLGVRHFLPAQKVVVSLVVVNSMLPRSIKARIARTALRMHTAMLMAGAVAIAPALGCAEARVSVAEGPRAYVAADYPEILSRWTRSRSLITVGDMDDVLSVTSTYESWDFRWAYVVRYAQDYRLTVEQRRVLLEKSLREASENHLFYVALYGSNLRWTDLTKPNSAWVVRLTDDQGNETAPTSIELVTRPSALDRRYFPYTTPWRQVFRIKFPRMLADGKTTTVAKNASAVGLRFAGAEGNQELKWVINPSADSPTADSMQSASTPAR